MLRVLLLFVLLAPAARAETFAFDVTLAGLRVAEMVVVIEETGGAWRATARVETQGAAGVLRRVRYVAAAEGRVAGGTLRPGLYREDISTGRRASRGEVAWRDGVPVVVAGEGIDPALAGSDLRGTVDPLTAIASGLRLTDGRCGLSLELFDGRRRASVRMGSGGTAEGDVLCAGRYRRVAGFTPQELSQAPGFDFVVRYAPEGDGRHSVVRIETETLFGRAVLNRRRNRRRDARNLGSRAKPPVRAGAGPAQAGPNDGSLPGFDAVVAQKGSDLTWL